jgi:hypothetical protein
MRRLWLGLAIALAAIPAAARDCSGVADPMAYNACLASQGPAARKVHVGGAPVGRPSARPAARGARRGRSEMVFSVRK